MSLGGLALSSTTAWAGNEEEVACPGESIHQEPIFKASRKRVYDALTDTKQFNNVTQLSAAIWPGQGEHLAAGWKANYWEPLEKFLA